MRSIFIYLTLSIVQVTFSAINAQITPITPPHPLPAGEALYWGNEPVVDLTSTQSEIVLNGLWEFMPATGAFESTISADCADWGYIRVPGIWRGTADWGWPLPLEGCVINGTSGIWNGINFNRLSTAWYKRIFNVPVEWIEQERKIVLYTNRLCNNAFVYAGDSFCGCLDNMGGSVDLTGKVTVGNNILIIKVNMLESNNGTAGLYDDVILKSYPKKYIDGFLVRTSVQNKTISIDLDLEGAEQAGSINVTAKIVDKQGEVVKTFTATSNVVKIASQTVKIAPWSWEAPLLWNYKQPNLYKMYVTVTGAGFDDECVETFGFREFRVVGRELYMNEQPFYLRPHLCYLGGGVLPVLRNRVEAIINTNFNCIEMWPGDNASNGVVTYQDKVAQVCSEKGLTLMYSILWHESFGLGGVWPYQNMALWNNYMAALKKDWKRYRNEPSVIILSAWGNRYTGGADDCNPTIMGNSTKYNYNSRWDLQYGKELVRWIKEQVDDIHPILNHNGIVGDIHSANVYLNLVSLQERENWTSQWAKSGDVPFSMIEFGTPLDMSFYRSREQDKGANYRSEPWATEFSSIYFGDRAYEMEPESYRNEIVSKYKGGMDYQEGLYSCVQVGNLPSTQELQELFIRNTWRSWRAFGFSGGFLPWGIAHGWNQILWNAPYVASGLVFEPGQRGTYLKSIASTCFYSEVDNSLKRPAGDELIKAQENILAYVGGYAGNYIGGNVLKFSEQIENFTSKDHHFYSGEAVKKSAVLVYDETFDGSYSMTWTATAGGSAISGSNGSKSGAVNSADRLFIPIEFTAPTVSVKTDGEIKLTTQINGKTIEDVFPITFYPKVSGNKTVYISDSEGKTKKAIEDLGYTAVNWNGEAGAVGKTLVVGRNIGKISLNSDPSVKYFDSVLSDLKDAGFPVDNVSFPCGFDETEVNSTLHTWNVNDAWAWGLGGKYAVVDAEDDVPFNQIVQFTWVPHDYTPIYGGSNESWQYQIRHGSLDEIKAGDLVIMSFYTRGGKGTQDTPFGTAENFAEGIPYQHIAGGINGNNDLLPYSDDKDEWTRVIVAFKFDYDMPANKGIESISLGVRGKDAEFGGICFVNLGQHANTFTNNQLKSMFDVFLGRQEPKLPMDHIKQFADEGGTVIIFGQQRSVLESNGFRSAHVVARRAFPVQTQVTHPLIEGLSAEDFRDWNGSGTLIPARDVSLYNSRANPYWVHWGNDGSVSSAVIEKPHYSNLTPILECEFDLQYTPLMESRSGNGAIVWCTLDVEGRTVKEPVADIVLKRLLEYQPIPISVRTTYYVGNNATDIAMLNSMNVTYTQQTTLPAAANALAIIGRDTNAGSLDLAGFISGGGNVFIMGDNAATKLGFGFVTNVKFHGSFDLPDWDECAGLSASDVRLRVDISRSVLNTAPANGSVGAGGLLGRYADGTGKALIIRLLPDQLGANQSSNSYLRFSKWRNSRTVAQCLTNLGAEFHQATSYYNADYISEFVPNVDDRDDPYRNHQW